MGQRREHQVRPVAGVFGTALVGLSLAPLCTSLVHLNLACGTETWGDSDGSPHASESFTASQIFSWDQQGAEEARRVASFTNTVPSADFRRAELFFWTPSEEEEGDQEMDGPDCSCLSCSTNALKEKSRRCQPAGCSRRITESQNG